LTVKDRDRIRIALLENSLSQVWLINRLEEHGVNTDKAELSSALSGARRGAKIDTIIKKSCEILDDYEQKMKK